MEWGDGGDDDDDDDDDGLLVTSFAIFTSTGISVCMYIYLHECTCSNYGNKH